MEDGTIITRAREWLNQGTGKTAALVAGLALLAGAAVWALRDEKDRKIDTIAAQGRRVLYVCKNPSCKARGTMRVPYEDEWPQPCPQCKETQAVKGFKCRQCGYILERTGAAAIRCPKCGRVHHNQGPTEDPSPPPKRR